MSYFDDNEERFTWTGFGRTRRRAGSFRGPRKSKFTTKCKHCGMEGLKWRQEGDGWRLFENERVESNKLKMHVCRIDEDMPQDLEENQ